MAGMAGLVAVGCDDASSAAAPPKAPAGSAASCDDVVESLLSRPDDPFVPLRQWLEQGVSPDRLFAAALEVGALRVPPDGDLHGVLGVGAGRVLAQDVVDEHPLMPLFRAWHDQHFVAKATTPPLPELGPLGPAETAELIAAWEGWDEDAADHAMVALYRAGGRDAVVGPLTLYGQRNHDWVGHTTIWTGHALRTLDAFGWSCAEPVLRHLARAIAANEVASRTSAFSESRALVSAMPSDWQNGTDDPSRVTQLAAILRDGDAETCRMALLDALHDGVSPRTLWTALAIVAIELSVRWQHASWGVHELDTLNAFRHIQAITPDPQTRAVALLQAAAWRPEFQAFVAPDPPVIAETLDALVPSAGAAPDLDAVLMLMGGNQVEAAHALAAYFAGGATADSIMGPWADVVVKHAGADVHHLKYHAALLEETRAALPEWRTTMLIGMAMRNPAPTDPAWPRYDEATAIIDALG
jgi:hypothetical protein